METTKIVLIIPAFNEEMTIEQVITDFHQQLPDAEIVVIDNNSSDSTSAIARRTLDQISPSGRLIFEGRQGKAMAMRTALSEIDADIYVMVDADSTYASQDVRSLIEPILAKEADMVVGDRHKTGAYRKENKRLFHNFGNSVVRSLINVLFKAQLHDILSGYRVFSRDFVKGFPILTKGFEIETEMTLHALEKRWRIVEIPVGYVDRPAGSFSKLNTFSDGIKVLGTIFSIFKYHKPFLFFSVMSLIFMIMGILTGSVVIAEFFATGYILHIPSAILSTGLMIISVVSLTIGIVLDTIVRLHNQEYELYRLNRFKNG